jgi:hypothetical protein
MRSRVILSPLSFQTKTLGLQNSNVLATAATVIDTNQVTIYTGGAMLVRLLAVVTFSFGVYAQAQNCISQLSLLTPCSGSAIAFSGGSGTCISGARVAANSSTSCQTADVAFSTANPVCVATKSCSSAGYSYDVTAKLQPYTVNADLYKVVMKNTCNNITSTSQVIVSNKILQNSSFISKYPAPTGSSYVRISLRCPSAPVKTTDSAGNSLMSYPEGCYIAASWSASTVYCPTLMVQ